MHPTDSLCPPVSWDALHRTLETAIPPRSRTLAPAAPLLLTHGHLLAARRHATHIVFQFATRLSPLPSSRHGFLTCDGTSYPCHVVTLTEDSVTLTIREALASLDHTHATLTLSTTDWYTGLRKRFSAIQAHPDTYHVDLAAKVFSQDKVPAPLSTPRHAEPTPTLNPAQRQAYERACTDDVLHIWGAPGTGKTTVIAHIVHTALTQGQRVLLCSTTNAAVDGAFTKLQQLAPTRHDELLRIGSPSPEMADTLQPFTLDARLAARAQPLEEELAAILDTQRQLQHQRTTLTHLLALSEQWERLRTQAAAISRQRAHRHDQLRVLLSRLQTTRAHAAQLTRALTRVRSSRLRAFLFSRYARFLEARLRTVSLRISALTDTIHTLEHEQTILLREQEETDDLLTHLATQRYALDPSGQLSASPAQLQDLDHRLDTLETRQATITESLQHVAQRCVDAARLLATTLTRSSSSALFHQESFDLVLVDEVSLASLPQLWATLCLAHTQVILVGDLLQLSPITPHLSSQHDRRLHGSIYDWSAITHVRHPLITALSTQYRMHPDIMALSAPLYHQRGVPYDVAPTLRDTVTPLTTFAPFPGTAVCWADTTHSPFNHIRRDAHHSPANWYHALILLHLVHQALNAAPTHHPPTLAVMSPYRAQVAFLQRLFAALQMPETVRIGTIHQFQGQQADLTFIDTTVIHALEHSLLCRETDGFSATKLFNVAVTRARGKVTFVGAHTAILALPSHSFLRQCLQAAHARGVVQDTNPWPVPHDLPLNWLLDRRTTEQDLLSTLTTMPPRSVDPARLRLVS